MINVIKTIDNTLDYIPVISTISNLADIIAKIVLGNLNKESIDKFPYFNHLTHKSYGRCITLLIPIVGNIAVILYDAMNDSSIEYNKSTGFSVVQNSRASDSPFSLGIFRTNSLNNSETSFPKARGDTSKKYSCSAHPRIL